MKNRLKSLNDAISALLDACRPVKRAWKVRYMKKTPHPTQPNMVTSTWTTEVVMAYSREGAAEKVNPKLRYGRNCYVTKIIPGVFEEEEGVE